MKFLAFVIFILSFETCFSSDNHEVNQLKKIVSLLQSQVNTLRKNEGKIGEIRYSTLNEENFQSLYGNGWVLMDGKETKAYCCEGSEGNDCKQKKQCPILDLLPKSHPMKVNKKLANYTKNTINIFSTRFNIRGKDRTESPVKFISQVEEIPLNSGQYKITWKSGFFKYAPQIFINIDSDGKHARVGQIIEKFDEKSTTIAVINASSGSTTTQDVDAIEVLVQRSKEGYRRGLAKDDWTNVYIKLK